MMKPLVSAQQLLEMEQRVKTLNAMMPTIIEEYTVNARVKREKFNALTKQGFTEDQAMQIILVGKDDLTL